MADSGHRKMARTSEVAIAPVAVNTQVSFTKARRADEQDLGTHIQRHVRPASLDRRADRHEEPEEGPAEPGGRPRTGAGGRDGPQSRPLSRGHRGAGADGTGGSDGLETQAPSEAVGPSSLGRGSPGGRAALR